MEGGGYSGGQRFTKSNSVRVVKSASTSSSKVPLRPIAPKGMVMDPLATTITVAATKKINGDISGKNKNKMANNNGKNNKNNDNNLQKDATAGKRSTTTDGGEGLAGREQDMNMPIANVIRIMRKVLPSYAKISDDAKDTIQECVSEYISFITGEANERCRQEQRKTITSEDLLWAMSKLGFDDYIEPLTVYLQRYRELEGENRSSLRGDSLPPIKRTASDAGFYEMPQYPMGAAQSHYPPPQHQPYPYLQQPVFFPNAGGSSSTVGGQGLFPGGGPMPVNYYKETSTYNDMSTYLDVPAVYHDTSAYHDVPMYRHVGGGYNDATGPSSSSHAGSSQATFPGFDPYVQYK